VQVDFAPPADYVEEPKPEPAAARPQAPVVREAPPPNLEHDSSEDEAAATAAAFQGSGQRLDGKTGKAKKVVLPVPKEAEAGASEDAAKPRFVGSSGTLSGKPAPSGPTITADPAAEALGNATTFGPALARTAWLRRLNEEREARAQGVTSASPVAPSGAPASEPQSDDYWANLSGGKTLR